MGDLCVQPCSAATALQFGGQSRDRGQTVGRGGEDWRGRSESNQKHNQKQKLKQQQQLTLRGLFSLHNPPCRLSPRFLWSEVRPLFSPLNKQRKEWREQPLAQCCRRELNNTSYSFPANMSAGEVVALMQG